MLAVHRSAFDELNSIPMPIRGFLAMLATPRVQVLNSHIVTQNLYYTYYYQNRKYLIIRYLDEKHLQGFTSSFSRRIFKGEHWS